MQALETRPDEELEREQKFKAAALAILGARAAERYDATAARAYFQRAIAAARPQERMQIRRMADASLALAERRPDDLKAAVERLGQAPPSGRQLLLLRAHGAARPAARAQPAPARARHPHWSRSSSSCSRSASASSSSSRSPFGGVGHAAAVAARHRCSSSRPRRARPDRPAAPGQARAAGRRG